MKLKTCIFILIITCIAALVCACGGSSSSDDSTENDDSTTYTMDEGAEDLAIAAQMLTAQVLAYEAHVADLISLPTLFSPFSLLDLIDRRAEDFGTDFKSNGTTTSSGSEAGSCGGSMDYDIEYVYDDENGYPYTVALDCVFDGYCQEFDGYQINFEGTVSLYSSHIDQDNWTSDMEYNLTCNSNIPSYPSGSYYFSESCTTIDGESTCAIGAFESGADTYSTIDLLVSENDDTGIDLEYSMTDNNGNTYTVEFEDLTLCENGNIGSGGGSITYNGSDISIDYISCDQFMVSYNGVTETYSQTVAQ
jgi:hypothetical protein